MDAAGFTPVPLTRLNWIHRSMELARAQHRKRGPRCARHYSSLLWRTEYRLHGAKQYSLISAPISRDCHQRPIKISQACYLIPFDPFNLRRLPFTGGAQSYPSDPGMVAPGAGAAIQRLAAPNHLPSPAKLPDGLHFYTQRQ